MTDSTLPQQDQHGECETEQVAVPSAFARTTAIHLAAGRTLSREDFAMMARLYDMIAAAPAAPEGGKDAARWNWCIVHQGKFNRIYRQWLEQEGSKAELNAAMDTALAASPKQEGK